MPQGLDVPHLLTEVDAPLISALRVGEAPCLEMEKAQAGGRACFTTWILCALIQRQRFFVFGERLGGAPAIPVNARNQRQSASAFERRGSAAQQIQRLGQRALRVIDRASAPEHFAQVRKRVRPQTRHRGNLRPSQCAFICVPCRRRLWLLQVGIANGDQKIGGQGSVCFGLGEVIRRTIRVQVGRRRRARAGVLLAHSRQRAKIVRGFGRRIA